MERISYSEDEDYPGQFYLWQSNCNRAIAGRRGQASLRELEAALLALPFKRLLAGVLEQGANVCAIGAMVHHKELAPKADPYHDMTDVGIECGMPRLVAWKVVCLNDIELSHLTPEARYEAVLGWVQSELIAGYRAALSKQLRPGG